MPARDSKAKKMRLPLPPQRHSRMFAMGIYGNNYPRLGQVQRREIAAITKFKKIAHYAERYLETKIVRAIMTRSWRELATAFLADEQAAVATEYALLIGLIAMAIFGAVLAFGNAVNNLFVTANGLLPFGS